MAEKDEIIICLQDPLKFGDNTEDGHVVKFSTLPWPIRHSDGYPYVNCVEILTPNGPRLADCYSGRILQPSELSHRIRPMSNVLKKPQFQNKYW